VVSRRLLLQSEASPLADTVASPVPISTCDALVGIRWDREQRQGGVLSLLVCGGYCLTTGFVALKGQELDHVRVSTTRLWRGIGLLSWSVTWMGDNEKILDCSELD
jgi:hypothetical protein